MEKANDLKPHAEPIPDPRSPEELALAILAAPLCKLALERKSTVKRDKKPDTSHQSR